MVDLSPNNTQNNSSKNWSQVVGGPQQNPTVNLTSDALPDEDKPPVDSKHDLLHAQAVADMQANRGLREKYADKAYNLAAGCLSMWAVLLGSNGVINALQGREMWSDKVIIAVTTGITVSILAAFLGVIRGLFPNHNTPKK